MNRSLERAIRDLAALGEGAPAGTITDKAISAAYWEHRDVFVDEVEAMDEARHRAAEERLRQRERGKAWKRNGNPLPSASAKRKSEKVARDAVRLATLVRAGWTCEGPGYGLPDRCRMIDMSRPVLETHETAQRSTHPGSHLDETVTVALCQWHHDMCTSPVGEMRELVESVGLLVRATDAAEHAVTNTKGNR